MDSQTFINAALGLVAFLGGWVLNSLKESMQQLREADHALTEKVQAIEILVAGTYVKRDDIDKLSMALFAKLDRIENKMEAKVNRDECGSCKP
jgi:hypothetical protein